ncbi:carbon-nitrogen hydrolase family protein [Paenibacillus ginsengarvi]|uniref:Carbon-nitrogen hydrolase family protein n=1 Tax=Paenibacillus ginsengarvi TaxID=400777 RepID=A0A3B0CGC3_9BACL|nr:carbon-nitrogen hydrolase family protein [Paenibacillus ginsengarvi]RKN84071.1 carbon-nitrogen hydrolase family protein [Paenibacillus ginsengarvi]
MTMLKVGIVQYNCSIPDPSLNTEIGLRYVNEAKSLGADIVLFPECWITAYAFPDIAESDLPVSEIERHPDFQAWYETALDENSVPLQQFRQIAKELSIGIVITGFTKGEKRPQNSAFVIDRNGEIILKYSKVHTCDFAAERLLESGTEFKVCEFDGIKLGIMICYDREYPESARMLMLKGAEIVLVPNDCGTMKIRLQALSTRAYENMIGIAMANTPGDNAGCSCAFSPIAWDRHGRSVDNTIILADEKTEGIFIATFDIDELRHYREREMMGNTFRKVNAYELLTSKRVEAPFIRT